MSKFLVEMQDEGEDIEFVDEEDIEDIDELEDYEYEEDYDEE